MSYSTFTNSNISLDSPTFLNRITTPIVYGGVGLTSTLTLNGTSNVSASGSTVLIQSGGGLVGIGTTTPYAGLTIRPQASACADRMLSWEANTSAVSRRWWMYSDAVTAGDFAISTESTKQSAATPNLNRFYISSGGSIGIGTCTPQGQLSFKSNNGSLTASVLTYCVQNQSVINSYNSNGGIYTRYLDIVSMGQPDGTNGDSAIRFLTVPKTTGCVADERMRITGDGNVGIGTSTPTYKLDVVGNVKFGIDTNSSTYVGTTSGIPYIQGSGTNNILAFYTNVEAMRIVAGGNVGIGTAAPTTSKLQVEGGYITAKDTGGQFAFMEGGATVAYFGSLSSSAISLYTGGFNRLYITSGGVVTIGALATGSLTSAAGVITSSSDANLKTSDGFIDCALPKIMNLTPRYFYWNEKSGLDKCTQSIRQLGFYAQEINKILGEEVANTPEEGKDWGYYDRGVIAMLTKAMQEQQLQINELKEEIKILKK